MTAMIRLRSAGFVRTGRALAPLFTALVVLGVLYGGGKAHPATEEVVVRSNHIVVWSNHV